MRFRCSHAVTAALYTNSRYRNTEWVKELAAEYYGSMLRKDGDASGLLDLPPTDAREMLLPEIPQILKAQRATGEWGRKDPRRKSYYYLMAMKHTGSLEECVLKMRHDPYRHFDEVDDWYSVAVRVNILESFRPRDHEVQDALLSKMSSEQLENGSWGGTVVATVASLETLRAIGRHDSPAFSKGIDYILSCIQEDVKREKKVHGGVVAAHNMISSEDRRAEFASAQAANPHWTPVAECYCHLPVIQTGYTLHFLNTSGYSDEPRVVAACQNLVEMRQRFGGWCESNIRNGLEVEGSQALWNG